MVARKLFFDFTQIAHSHFFVIGARDCLITFCVHFSIFFGFWGHDALHFSSPLTFDYRGIGQILLVGFHSGFRGVVIMVVVVNVGLTILRFRSGPHQNIIIAKLAIMVAMNTQINQFKKVRLETKRSNFSLRLRIRQQDLLHFYYLSRSRLIFSSLLDKRFSQFYLLAQLISFDS